MWMGAAQNKWEKQWGAPCASQPPFLLKPLPFYHPHQYTPHSHPHQYDLGVLQNSQELKMLVA